MGAYIPHWANGEPLLGHQLPCASLEPSNIKKALNSSWAVEPNTDGTVTKSSASEQALGGK
jgi:hypothetical protein